MSKRGMIVWEVLVWAIILLVVAAILIFVFRNLLNKQETGIRDQITGSQDSDHDLVPDAFEPKGCIGDPKGQDVKANGCTKAQEDALNKPPSPTE